MWWTYIGEDYYLHIFNASFSCNSMTSMMLRIEMKLWWNVRSVEWRVQKCKFMSWNEKETGSVAFSHHSPLPPLNAFSLLSLSLSHARITMGVPNWHRQIMMETLHINEMIYKWNIIFSLQLYAFAYRTRMKNGHLFNLYKYLLHKSIFFCLK